MADDSDPEVFGGAPSRRAHEEVPHVFGAAPTDTPPPAPSLPSTSYDSMPAPDLLAAPTTGYASRIGASGGVAPVAAGTPTAGPDSSAVPKRRSRVRGRGANPVSGARVLFILGFVGTAILAVLLFDQLGPKTHRSATVTSKVISRHTDSHGRRTTDHTVKGVDDVGGTFSLDVRSDSYDAARIGQRITVSRALLTGRVVEVHDAPWSLTSTTFRAVLYGIFCGISLVLLLLGVWLHRKAIRLLDPAGRRRANAIVFGLGAVILAGVVVWIFAERSKADIGSLVALSSVVRYGQVLSIGS